MTEYLTIALAVLLAAQWLGKHWHKHRYRCEVELHARTAAERDHHCDIAAKLDKQVEWQGRVIQDLTDENCAYYEKFGPIKVEREREADEWPEILEK